MKRKEAKKRLVLSKEQIRQLDATKLPAIRGGGCVTTWDLCTETRD